MPDFRRPGPSPPASESHQTESWRTASEPRQDLAGDREARIEGLPLEGSLVFEHATKGARVSFGYRTVGADRLPQRGGIAPTLGLWVFPLPIEKGAAFDETGTARFEELATGRSTSRSG